MTTRTTPRIGLFGIALGMIVFFGLSGKSQAQQVDLNAAAEAKAEAGREARSRPVTDPPGPKAAGTFITFDAPAAGTAGGQGTFRASISPAGVITGYYTDANFVSHGFLRASNGAITAFDVPGGTFTFPFGINPPKTITGLYAYINDPNLVVHGFLRTSFGTLTTFDAPGSCTSCFVLGTFPSSINPTGVITGAYTDASVVVHGFLRARDGSFTTFDATGAGTDSSQGTQPVVINPEGAILGIFTDGNNVNHGFLRANDGTFTTFDPPGQISGGSFFLFSSAPFSFGPDLAMNPAGVITGTYFQLISGNPFGGNFRVFVRATDGTFTTFDAVMFPNGNPGMNIPCCTWSFPSGITPSG